MMRERFLTIASEQPSVGIPEQEKDLLAIVSRNLLSMTSYSMEAESAVALYNAIEQTTDAPRGWAFIPAKQMIVSIYNYRMAMDSVVTLATRRSKFMPTAVDTARLIALRDHFRDLFPRTKELRQALMHNAELTANEERIRETNLRKDKSVYNNMVMLRAGAAHQFNFFDQNFQVTFAGEVHMLEISLKNAKVLRENCIATVNVFNPLGVRASF